MAEAKLNWASAQVSDGALKVELDGELEKGWKDSFNTTVRLLGNGDWDEVELKKGSIRVSGVTPGTEDKLRHYLESVVAQANASQAPPEEEATEGDDENATTDEDDGGPDAEMTARFRAFDEGSDDQDSSPTDD
jgi:hypothetical protein